ncbi:MAG: 30S ribosomal protein S27ae [Candidatus Aenigmatarchaeota archaeon]
MKHKQVRQADFFAVEEGKINRKLRSCPRCGSGVFMAEHEQEGKKRYYCGKCRMTIWE